MKPETTNSSNNKNTNKNKNNNTIMTTVQLPTNSIRNNEQQRASSTTTAMMMMMSSPSCRWQQPAMATNMTLANILASQMNNDALFLAARSLELQRMYAAAAAQNNVVPFSTRSEFHPFSDATRNMISPVSAATNVETKATSSSTDDDKKLPVVGQQSNKKRRLEPEVLESSSSSTTSSKTKKARSNQCKEVQPTSVPSGVYVVSSQQETSSLDDDESTSTINDLPLSKLLDGLQDTSYVPVTPSNEGYTTFTQKDVLFGRGTYTNLHAGNKAFRDLIECHRRSYLDSLRREKQVLSKAVVRAIRKHGGRFLKKNEDTGLWFEVGDQDAKEKASQAFRQRGPRIRKMMFENGKQEKKTEQPKAATATTTLTENNNNNNNEEIAAV